MKKYIFSIVAAAAFVFVGCNQVTPYVPGEKASADAQSIYFPVSSEVGLELDPEANITSHDVVIARKDASNALTVPFIVTVNTEDVFSIPESVSFAAGETQKTFTVNFGKMEIGSTYGFKISVDPALIDPYKIDTLADGSLVIPYYEYEATLIKYVAAEGVFVDDAVIASTWGVDPAIAWTVEYQIAELPSGLRKIRIVNPFNCMASAVDENGIYDGYPYNEEGDFDAANNYHIYLYLNPETGDVTLENSQLGVDWGYGMMGVVNYGDGAVGEYDEEKGVITFDADNQTMAFTMGGDLYNYAGFRLYFSKEAYLTDQEEEEPFEPVNAEISTYEGAYTLVAFDYFESTEVTFDVTISSDEDEDGHYYVIEGIEDATPTWGLFDEDTHQLQIVPNFYLPSLVLDDIEYDTYLIPVTDQPSFVEDKPILLEPDAEGNLVVSSNSAATGFAIYVENPDDEEDAGLYALYTEIEFKKAAAAAEVSAKSMAKREHKKPHLLKKGNFKTAQKK